MGLDEFERFEVKGQCIQIFSELTKCYGNNLDEKKGIKSFLKNNENIILIKIDKSKNVCFLDKTDYIKKLNNEFNNPSYEKLSQNPLSDDIESFNQLITTMQPYISIRNFYEIKPRQNIKKCYGILK